MTRPLQKVLITCGLLVGLLPVYHVLAQEEQNDRLDDLFIQDEGPMDPEARREAFAREHPEMAARMQQRREEMEAKRADFEARYPEAAAELKAWREEGKAEREKERSQREERGKQFAEKYPEAAADLKSMMGEGRRPGGKFRERRKGVRNDG